MTLALYGKSRQRQGGLLFAGFIAVLIAMVAGIATVQFAFAHHLEGAVKTPTCEDQAWKIQVRTGTWDNYREAVLTNSGSTAVTLPFEPFIYRGADRDIVNVQGTGAVNAVGNVKQYTGSFTDTEDRVSAVDGSATSLVRYKTNPAQSDTWDNDYQAGTVVLWGSELIKVSARSGDGKTLTVERGFGGTTASSHSNGSVNRWVRGGLNGSPNTISWNLNFDPASCAPDDSIVLSDSACELVDGLPNALFHFIIPSGTPQNAPNGYPLAVGYTGDVTGAGNDNTNERTPQNPSTVHWDVYIPFGTNASITADTAISAGYNAAWGGVKGAEHKTVASTDDDCGVVLSTGKVIVKKVGPTITGDLANTDFGGAVTKNGGGHDGTWTAKVGGKDTTNDGLDDGDYQVAEDNMPMTVTGGKIQFVGFQEVDGEGVCPAPTEGNYNDDGLVSVDDDTKTVCVLNEFVADPPACVDYTYNEAAIKNFITSGVDQNGTAWATLSGNFDGCELPQVRFSLYELTGSSWNNYSNWAGQVHLKTQSQELVKGQKVDFDLRPFEVCNYQLDLYLTNDAVLNDGGATLGTGELASPNGEHRPAPHHTPDPDVLLKGGSGVAYWIEQGNRCINVRKLVDASSPYGGAFELTAGSQTIQTPELEPGQSYSEAKVFKAANPDTGVNVNELLPLGWLNASGFPKYELEQGGQLVSSGALSADGVTITAGGSSTVTIINKSLVPPRIIEVCKVWDLSNDDITDPDAAFTITSDQGHSVPLTVSEGDSEGACETIEVEYDAEGVLISELLPAGFTSKTGEGYPKYVVEYATASDVAASGTSVTVDLDLCAVALEGQIDRFLQIAGQIVAVPSCTVTFYNKDGGETLPTGGLRIEKYLDLNGDGDANDLGEGPLVGWNMTVKGAGIDGTFPTADLDLNDLFAEAAISFDGLDSGEKYDVTEETRAGYVLTGVRIDGAPVALGASKTLTIPEGGTTVIQYFNQPRTGIKVSKTEVSLAHPGGAPGAGWSFTLSGCGIAPQVAATNSAGQAQFDNLPLAVNCTYTVTETQKAGWSAINPVQAANPVTPGGYTTLSFTNVKIEVCVTGCITTFETPTPTATPEKPTATPTPTEEPKVEDPADTPTPVDETRGERTPGATPIAPSTGYGLLGGQAGGTNLLLIAAGLMALSGGTVVLAVARRRR